MAYMNQERKSALAPAIKAILKKFNMKGSVAVRNHSTLVVNIKQGVIDFQTNYISVNEYYIKDHYEGVARDFLLELKEAMMLGNFNHSDIQSDYFHVGWWIDINVGQWDKPYTLTA